MRDIKNLFLEKHPLVFKDENPFLNKILIVFPQFVFGSLLTQFLFKSRSNLMIRMTGGRWKKIFQKLSITPPKQNEKKPKLSYQQEIDSQGKMNLHLYFTYSKIICGHFISLM